MGHWARLGPVISPCEPLVAHHCRRATILPVTRSKRWISILTVSDSGNSIRPANAAMTMRAKDKIAIYGPKHDGTFIVEFRTSQGEALAISVARSEAAVLKHFQARMHYGIVVPDVQNGSRHPLTFPALGYHSGHEYWDLVVKPAYLRFAKMPNRASANAAAKEAWRFHEWIWYDRHTEDTDNNPEYENFVANLISRCKELSLLRDVADSAKHPSLGRAMLKLKAVTSSEGPGGLSYEVSPFGRTQTTLRNTLQIELVDGTTQDFADALKATMNFWKAELTH